MPLEERDKVRKIAKWLISFETPIRPKGKPHPELLVLKDRKSKTSSKDANGEIDADMVAIGERVIQRRSRAF